MRRRLPWLAVAIAVVALVWGWILRPGSTDSFYLRADRGLVRRRSARCSR